MFVVMHVSEMESGQQPAEEAGPLGTKEADEEVDHCGDEDDSCGDVVQVVKSPLIGHHVQVPAGYNTHTHTDKCTNTRFQIFPTHTHTQLMLPFTWWYTHSQVPLTHT